MKYINFFLFLLFVSCSSIATNTVKDSQTGIEGVVYNENTQPVREAYVYLYRSLSSKLIGPADFMEKSNPNGEFFFDVPEGKYYIVVRKRAHGGDAGPLKQGDRVAIYSQNPVLVFPNKISKVNITLPEKGSFFLKRFPIGDTKLSLKILPETNKILKLLIYTGENIKRAPDFVVDINNSMIDFSLDKGKKYILVVREELREKVGENEFYAEFGPFSPEDINPTIELNKGFTK